VSHQVGHKNQQVKRKMAVSVVADSVVAGDPERVQGGPSRVEDVFGILRPGDV
jgi:hypothetical protein